MAIILGISITRAHSHCVDVVKKWGNGSERGWRLLGCGVSGEGGGSNSKSLLKAGLVKKKMTWPNFPYPVNYWEINAIVRNIRAYEASV